ncbi:ligand-binding sensor domain-containing protein [Paludisphaera mucosa]|uniref:Two-component regulator propeller domain-containing protein n=1 Tax=Paludisphaera mucosa TaxID=3030827 RepID=A0ABT6F4R7_9BACT|nr:two-component regulator propeller domain-containing protein [Paludisphaera mucosa]MDG3002583.1 two-component regulator propeller domain-containing protein [Paludisphaera mucosa]
MKNVPTLCLAFTALLLTNSSGGVRATVQDLGVTPRASKPKLTRTQGGTEYMQVRCGLQDGVGNHWFGTTGEGVYRYDGKGFTQYTVEDGLNSNIVWSILEDKKGRIWFGTDSGLSRWDGKGIRSVPIPPASESSGSATASPKQALAAQTVWSMLEDRKGTIWFGTSEGVFRCEGEVIVPFLEKGQVRNPSGLHLKMVDDILEDRRGILWLASGMPPGREGLCRFDGTSLTRFNPGGEEWIRTVVEDPKGDLWLGTRHKGVWRYDGKTFSRCLEQEGLGMPLLVDRSGNVWFSGVEGEDGLGNSTGIWRYDGKSFRNFSAKEGPGKYGVWCMFEDRDGDIWVGTRNTGLYRYAGGSFTRFSE